MNPKRLLRMAIWLLALTLVPGLGSAIGQQTAPTETKGMQAATVGAVDLGPEIDGMHGRQLRMRIVTLDPGGVVGVHSHKDRPGIAYVLEGTVIEHRGDVAAEYHAGGSWTEDKGLIHWVENKGTKPAVVIAVDIFKQP